MPEVFVKKIDRVEPSFSLGVLLARKETKGAVGIEIEVEGERLPKESHTPPPWLFHVDGSLRGKENAEYVLNNPIEFDGVPAALKILWDKFKEMGSVLDESNRTSVHIHLNCQQFHFNRLTSFMALYFTFEEVLTAWCGESRVGNLFCLRAKDAPAIVSQIRKFIVSDGKRELRDNLHYAGLNAHALNKFGSVEIRTLRGVSDPAIIQSWVDVLARLYRLSAEFHDPRDICSLFSAEGPLSFFENVLGDMSITVRKGVPFNDDQIRESMYEGIRMAQDLCYCRDWTLFKALDLKADPFGRDPRRMMKRLSGGEALAAELLSPEAQWTTTLNELSTMFEPAPVPVLQTSAPTPTPEAPEWYQPGIQAVQSTLQPPVPALHWMEDEEDPEGL